jgi:excisionase family DNA binding protein
MESDQKVVMTVPEVAYKLGISLPSAYRAVKAGTIPTIKIGNVLRVPVASFNKLISGGEAK